MASAARMALLQLGRGKVGWLPSRAAREALHVRSSSVQYAGGARDPSTGGQCIASCKWGWQPVWAFGPTGTGEERLLAGARAKPTACQGESDKGRGQERLHVLAQIYTQSLAGAAPADLSSLVSAPCPYPTRVHHTSSVLSAGEVLLSPSPFPAGQSLLIS